MLYCQSHIVLQNDVMGMCMGEDSLQALVLEGVLLGLLEHLLVIANMKENRTL